MAGKTLQLNAEVIECLRSMCIKTRRGRAKEVRMVNECEINCLKRLTLF